jgi:tetratricopeptide (TPR) repeat protein
MKLACAVALLLPFARAAPARASQDPTFPLVQLEAAAQRDSNDAEVLFRLGIAYARAGRGTDAQRLLLATVRTDPQHALGYLALAQYHRGFDRMFIQVPGRSQLLVVPRFAPTDTAVLFLRRAFQINPFIEIHTPGLMELPAFWRGTLQLAIRHYHEAKLTQALDELGSLIQRTQKPGHPESIPPVALWYHILTAIRLGRFDVAIQDGEVLLDRALQEERDDRSLRGGRLVADVEYILAFLNQAAGHAAEAERPYQSVMEGDLSFYMAHAKLADLYESQGRWDESILERRRAVDANPEDPSLVFDLGGTLARASRDSEAAQVLTQAVQANPRETRAAYTLGIVEARLGKTQEARTAFTSFLALAPSRYTELIADAKLRLAALP